MSGTAGGWLTTAGENRGGDNPRPYSSYPSVIARSPMNWGDEAILLYRAAVLECPCANNCTSESRKTIDNYSLVLV